jgi:prepilin-type N-terminal cleavage/methylation domain-containing protein
MQRPITSLPRGIRQLARKGFTLVEMMVAIAIAGFTVAALYGLFSVQSRQLVHQDLQMEMHQNLRFATEMITRSARLSGYGSSGYIYGLFGPNGIGDNDDPLPAVIPWNDPNSSGPDAVTLVYAEPSMLMDTQNDVIESYDTTQLTFRPSMLDYATKLAQYQAGDLLICTDYADIRGMTSYLWSITAVDTGNGVISVSSNDAHDDYTARFTRNTNLTPVLTCSKGSVVTFYVDNLDDGIGAGSSDHPVLMLDLNMSWPANDDVPLVDNIEDLQLEYCVDDGSGLTECTDSTAWETADTLDATVDADNMWMMRVHLVARSSRDDPRNQFPGFRPSLSDRSASGAPGVDNFYRKVLVTEVAFRNLRSIASL